MKNKFFRLCPLFFLLAAASSQASPTSQVTVYGVVDMGVSWSKRFGDDPEKVGKSSLFSLNSGQRNSSRFGIKGFEDLGNGWGVSFVLENQFNADTGEETGGAWGRESTIALSGPYGKFTFGHTGMLKSPVGTTALCNTRAVNPFGNVMHNFIPGHKAVTAGSYLTVDNSITYASPKIASSYQFFGQYSFQMNGEEKESMGDNTKYYSVAGRYAQGPLMGTLILDRIDNPKGTSKTKHPMTATLAVNYDFGPVRPYFFGQYFYHSKINTLGKFLKGNGHYNGFGGLTTFLVPAWGGEAKFEVGYMHARESEGPKSRIKRYAFAVGYDYPVSKQFHLYADAGYIIQKTDAAKNLSQKAAEMLIGCVKFF